MKKDKTEKNLKKIESIMKDADAERFTFNESFIENSKNTGTIEDRFYNVLNSYYKMIYMKRQFDKFKTEFEKELANFGEYDPWGKIIFKVIHDRQARGVL